jgi:7-cyano-7-deazaguanine synthase
MDSTTLLYQLLNDNLTVTALSIDYGQRHIRELASAEEIAKTVNVPIINVNLGPALRPIFALAKSSQVGQLVDVPEGHYADETMKLTVVPNRNMMLLSVAGALAVSTDASLIAYAAHAGDHPVYADCRPEFIESFAQTLFLATGVQLYDPFQGITKADIAKRADILKVPLGLTWSCYRGGDIHCGRCSTCVERREAMSVAGITDPTEYLDKTDYWRTVSTV